MKFPWTKRGPTADEMAAFVAAEERRLEDQKRRDEERARYQEGLQREAEWRAQRIMAIPQNLEGFRLANGCSCGEEEKWFRATGYWPNGSWYSSAQPRHEPGCDRLLGIMVQIIEVAGPPPKPWLEESVSELETV